jgi:hypothetical protein
VGCQRGALTAARVDTPGDGRLPPPTARDRFAELARRRDENLGPAELELGATLIAAEEYPDLDLAGVRDALDALGARASERLAGVPRAMRAWSGSTASCSARRASRARANTTTRATAT